MACQTRFAAQIRAEETIATGKKFLSGKIEQVPAELAEQIKQTEFTDPFLYLLGAAVQHGRRQERALGEHPAGGTSTDTRIDFIDLAD